VFASVPKHVHGVAGLYVAGRWVEVGGGVPPALWSGRQAVQLLAHDLRIAFRTELAH
jgi:hypothetical protein